MTIMHFSFSISYQMQGRCEESKKMCVYNNTSLIWERQTFKLTRKFSLNKKTFSAIFTQSSRDVTNVEGCVLSPKMFSY